jgi:hypothetical protein
MRGYYDAYFSTLSAICVFVFKTDVISTTQVLDYVIRELYISHSVFAQRKVNLVIPIHAMKACRGGGIAALIPNRITRWRWVVRFTP